MPAESPSPSVDEKLSALWGLAIGLLFMAGGLWVQQIHLREQATLTEVQWTIGVLEPDSTLAQVDMGFPPRSLGEDGH